MLADLERDTCTTNSGGGFVYTTAVGHFAIAYQHYVLLVWGLVCQTPYQSMEAPWRYTRSHRHTKGLWCCAWYTRRHVESGIHAEALLDGIPGQCVCTCTSWYACRGFGAFMHVFRIEHTHTQGGAEVPTDQQRLTICTQLQCCSILQIWSLNLKFTMAIHDHKQSVQKLETALDNTVTNLQLMHMNAKLIQVRNPDEPWPAGKAMATSS